MFFFGFSLFPFSFFSLLSPLLPLTSSPHPGVRPLSASFPCRWFPVNTTLVQLRSRFFLQTQRLQFNDNTFRTVLFLFHCHQGSQDHILYRCGWKTNRAHNAANMNILYSREITVYIIVYMFMSVIILLNSLKCSCTLSGDFSMEK